MWSLFIGIIFLIHASQCDACLPKAPSSIIIHSSSEIDDYPKKVTVFGIPIFAGEKWKKYQLNHVAFILAKFLDNDENGCVDDPKVLKALLKVNGEGYSRPLMLLDEESEAEFDKAALALEEFDIHRFGAATLAEVNLKCSVKNYVNDPDKLCTDATIEEVFHFFTDNGISRAYPAIFGTSWKSPSKLTKAMDAARGGRFKKVPKKYPKSAWYSYDDTTCEYTCQATEYLWWAYCSYSTVCAARSQISDFNKEFNWLLKTQLVQKDTRVASLLENKNGYVFPTKPPTGTYMGRNIYSF